MKGAGTLEEIYSEVVPGELIPEGYEENNNFQECVQIFNNEALFPGGTEGKCAEDY